MQEVNPAGTTRAYAFEMWMKAPMPMVTLFKKLDVTRLRRISRRQGLKFNMLMCWCIGRAASQVKEFYMLPVGGKLMQYDSIAVNTIVPKSGRRGQFMRHTLYRRPHRFQRRLSLPDQTGSRYLR